MLNYNGIEDAQLTERDMTRTEALLMRVRTHVAGETRESLHRAGYFDWEIQRQIAYGHLREAPDGRIRYVHRDIHDDLETR